MMGSPQGESGRDWDERQQSVTVGGFAIGKYEVTRAQYAAFVAATGYRGGSSCSTYENGELKDRTGRDWRNPGYHPDDHDPVVCVSLEDAEAYARWLSGRTGRHYRLPTEAEWEYAARSGTQTARFWGDDPNQACDYANVADQTAKKEYPWLKIHDCADGAVHITTVGRYRANHFGLFDMLGNVLEWTCSAYTGGGYDGHENECTNDAGSSRVVRGGSWVFPAAGVRSAIRSEDGPTLRNFNVGFRLARD